MQIMSVGEFKTNFSEALKRVQAGERSHRLWKSKQVVAAGAEASEKKNKRKLGIWRPRGR